MNIGDKVKVLLMEDDHYGRVGTVVKVSRSLVNVLFTDRESRYYNNMDGMDIKKI